MLVEAGAAGGKTTLLKQLALAAAKWRADGADDVVPVLVHAAALGESVAARPDAYAGCGGDLVGAYVRLETAEADPCRWAMLSQALASRRALVLLDGLDELGGLLFGGARETGGDESGADAEQAAAEAREAVAAPAEAASASAADPAAAASASAADPAAAARARAARAIDAYLREYAVANRVPLVATSRPLGGDALGPDFTRVRLLPAARAQQELFAENRLGGGAARASSSRRCGPRSTRSAPTSRRARSRSRSSSARSRAPSTAPGRARCRRRLRALPLALRATLRRAGLGVSPPAAAPYGGTYASQPPRSAPPRRR